MWWPDLQAWIPALAVIGVLLTLNLVSVKNFGEIEFWFSMIKIVAIVADYRWRRHDRRRFTLTQWRAGIRRKPLERRRNVPQPPDWLPRCIQIAVFAFMGSELVGTTAAETKDPESLPKALNAVPVRIMVFYVVALAVILMVTPGAWSALIRAPSSPCSLWRVWASPRISSTSW